MASAVQMLHIYEGDKGAAEVTPPTILGHEFSGVVTEVGSSVTNVKVGNRVCIDPNCYCGKCDFCRNGIAHYCTDMIGYGTTVNGGFAEYCSVNQRQVYKLGVLTWCGKVQSAGYYVGIYANPYWFLNRFDLERLKGFDKWLAHWVSTPKWKNEFGGLWQYGLTNVDGYNGDIDGDYSYRDYEKTIKTLGLNGFGKATVTVVIDGKTYTGDLKET